MRRTGVVPHQKIVPHRSAHVVVGVQEIGMRHRTCNGETARVKHTSGAPMTVTETVTVMARVTVAHTPLRTVQLTASFSHTIHFFSRVQHEKGGGGAHWLRRICF